MAFTPRSAKNSRVRLGAAGAGNPATVWTAKKWLVDPKTDPADTSNFEGGGFGDAIGCLIEADVNITDSDWDFAQNSPYDPATYNLQPTQVISAKMFPDALGSAGVFWLFTNALVKNVPNTCAVREAVKIDSIALYGKGSFSFPLGQ